MIAGEQRITAGEQRIITADVLPRQIAAPTKLHSRGILICGRCVEAAAFTPGLPAFEVLNHTL